MTTAQDGGKVVSLTHWLPLPPRNTPGTHFCQRMSRPQGHGATGRIMSLKNSNGTIGNRTRDLPVCSIVPLLLLLLLTTTITIIIRNIYTSLKLPYCQSAITFLKKSPKEPVRFGFLSLLATACSCNGCCCCLGDSCTCCLFGDASCEVEGCGCLSAPVGWAWIITLPVPGT